MVNLKNILTEEEDWTDQGKVVFEILSNFEDPFSSDAIEAAAKEIDVNAEELKDFFADKKNDGWRVSILEDQQVRIEILADELKNLRLRSEDEWKIRKALTIVESKNKKNQEEKKKFHEMIDNLTENLKNKIHKPVKELSKEFNDIIDFRKKLLKLEKGFLYSC